MIWCDRAQRVAVLALLADPLLAAALGPDSLAEAPLAGRVSNRRVDQDNLIADGQSDATLLTTIVAVDPIKFVFDASEADYLRYAKSQDLRKPGTPVRIRLSNETK